MDFRERRNFLEPKKLISLLDNNPKKKSVENNTTYFCGGLKKIEEIFFRFILSLPLPQRSSGALINMN